MSLDGHCFLARESMKADGRNVPVHDGAVGPLQCDGRTAESSQCFDGHSRARTIVLMTEHERVNAIGEWQLYPESACRGRPGSNGFNGSFTVPQAMHRRESRARRNEGKLRPSTVDRLTFVADIRASPLIEQRSLMRPRRRRVFG